MLELGADICTVEERCLTLSDVAEATEVFITSTTKGIVSVRKIDAIEYSQTRHVTTTLSEKLTVLIDDCRRAAKMRN